MSKDLLALYQQIRETPALTVDLPEESGQGRIVRLDTNTFSLSSWNMAFNKDTYVEGNVPDDMRLLFCTGDGVEWITERGSMRLDSHEACFCRSDGSPEKMCYHGKSSFSFLSVSLPTDRFAGIIGGYIPDPERMMALLPGKRFAMEPSEAPCLLLFSAAFCISHLFTKNRLTNHGEQCILSNIENVVR